MKNQNTETAATYNSAMRFIQITGALSLVLAPLLTFTGWAIAHENLGSFLSFNLTWTASDGTTQLTAASDPALIFRYYLLPHYFIYSAFPFYIALAIVLTIKSYKKAPWHSFLGLILSIIGSVYFIGVLGAFLSNAIGSVNPTNILKISFLLCMLVFVGNVVQGFALLKTRVLTRWQSILFILGNLLILIFPGVENWMALGSLCMLVALFPLAVRIMRHSAN